MVNVLWCIFEKGDLKKSRRRRLNQSSTWPSGTLSGESHVWVWSGEIHVLVSFSGVGFGKRSRFFVGHGLYLMEVCGRFVVAFSNKGIVSSPISEATLAT